MRKSGGRDNAKTYGLYVEDYILEDEDLEEFEKVHQSEIEEWRPTGITETETVFDLAYCIWFRRRAERFHKEEMELIQEYMSESELSFLQGLVDAMNHFEDETNARHVIALLPDVYTELINRKFPRANYADEHSWIQALRSSGMPRIMQIQEAAVRRERSDMPTRLHKAARVRESLEAKIRLDERLDFRIEKALKRLNMLKTFKEVIKIQQAQVKTIEHHPTPDPA